MSTPVRWSIALFMLGLAFGPTMARHVARIGQDLTFNDDARQQVVPFFRYTADSVVGPDLSGDYQLDLIPPGYRALYRWTAPVIDPVTVSKTLPYLLLAVLLIAVAFTANRIGGYWAAVLSIALTLQSSAFLERMIGGLPRAFAFPLVAVGLAAVVAGRSWGIAIACVIAAWTYPIAGVLLGLMLALFLFLPGPDRGDAATWSLMRRVATLSMVAVGALVPAIVVSSDSAKWGRRLGPGDWVTYPEVGTNGRYDPDDMIPTDRNPVPDLFVEGDLQFQRTLRSQVPWNPSLRSLLGYSPWLNRGLALAVVVGTIVLAGSGCPARRVAVLPVAAMVGFLVATLAAPLLHLPQRFLAYALPILAVVVLPASILAGGSRTASWSGRRGFRVAAGVLLTLGVLGDGGPGNPEAGYSRTVEDGRQVLEFVSTLPASVLVAGWPTGILEDVPYVSRRRAFLNRENHQVFHEGYTLAMRHRMEQLVAAVFGPDRSAIVSLRDEGGVTHLIIDTTLYESPPSYFAPFDGIIQSTWREGRASGFASLAAVAEGAVFREGPLVVLDLTRLR